MTLRLTTLALFILFHSICAQALITITGDKSFTFTHGNNINHDIEFGSEIDGNINYVAVIRHQSIACLQNSICLVYLVRTNTGRYFARFQERTLGCFVAMAGNAASLSPDTLKPIVTHPQDESTLLKFDAPLQAIALPELKESSNTGRIVTIPVDVHRPEDTSNSIELRKVTSEKEGASKESRGASAQPETISSEKLAGDMRIIDEQDFHATPR